MAVASAARALTERRAEPSSWPPATAAPLESFLLMNSFHESSDAADVSERVDRILPEGSLRPSSPLAAAPSAAAAAELGGVLETEWVARGAVSELGGVLETEWVAGGAASGSGRSWRTWPQVARRTAASGFMATSWRKALRAIPWSVRGSVMLPMEYAERIELASACTNGSFN